MTKFFKRHGIALLLLLFPFALAALLYNKLPDMIPIHWGIDGTPDDWASKTWAIWLMPAINVAVYLLIGFVVRLDPKGNFEKNRKAVHALQLILAGFFSAVITLMLLYPIYPDMDFGAWMVMLLLSMFILIGNFFGKMRPNYFMGIRTPWTLQNEQVWIRTHRFGGMLWVMSSLVVAGLFFLLPRTAFYITLIPWFLLVVLGPIVYSYVAYKRLKDE